MKTATALLLASIGIDTFHGSLFTLAQAAPAPAQPAQHVARPRYYFPRHIKRQIVTSNSTTPSDTPSNNVLGNLGETIGDIVEGITQPSLDPGSSGSTDSGTETTPTEDNTGSGTVSSSSVVPGVAGDGSTGSPQLVLSSSTVPEPASSSDGSGGLLGVVTGIVAPLATGIVNPVVSNVVDPVVSNVVAPVVDPVVSNVVDPVVSGVVDPLASGIVNPVVSGVASGVLAPVGTGVVAPLVTGVVDPVASAVIDPVASGVVDPLASGVINPVASGVVDPLASGVVNPVVSGVVAPVVSGVASGVVAPIGTGVLAPVVTGVVDPVASGVVDPLASGVVDPLASGVIAPVVTGVVPGVVSGVASGVIAPIGTGVIAPVASGIIDPVVSGVVDPVASGVIAPVASGVIAPVASGVLDPVASGVIAPVASGVIDPVASGVINPVVSGVVPIVTGIADPAVSAVVPPLVSGVASIVNPIGSGLAPGASDVVPGVIGPSILPAPALSDVPILSNTGILVGLSTAFSGGLAAPIPAPTASAEVPLQSGLGLFGPGTGSAAVPGPSASVPLLVPGSEGPSVSPPLNGPAQTGPVDPPTLVAPTSLLAAPAPPSGKPSPTESGIPTSMPKVIVPPGGSTVKPDNTTLIQIGFTHELNYAFVSTNPVSAQQIFAFLPNGVAYGLLLDQSKAKMYNIQPYDTSKTMGFITTLALMYVPTDLVSQLDVDLHTPNSGVYRNPDSTTNQLMNFINPAIPLIAGQPMDGTTQGNQAAEAVASTAPNAPGGGSPFTNEEGNSQTVKSSAVAIGTATAAGVALYGAAMVLVARRYRKKRQSHSRSSSLTGSEPGWMANGGYSRNSHGSGSSQGRSIRSQGISAPVMSENSLGWN